MYKSFFGNYYEFEKFLENLKDGEVISVFPYTNTDTAETGIVAVVKQKQKNKREEKKDRLLKDALHELVEKVSDEVWAYLDEGGLEKFYDYRKQIKKPVKTSKPLIMFGLELDKLAKDGFDIYECIEIMENREWQTIKREYFKDRGNGEFSGNFM
jgi:hypothetical protein